MIAGNIKALKSFIEAQSLAITGVEHFLFGDAIKLITYSKSNPKMGYPLVHLSKPIIVPTDNGFANHQVTFYCEITSFTKVDRRGPASDADDLELDALDQCTNILLSLEKKFRKAHRTGDIEFQDNPPELEPLFAAQWNDSYTGYKMTLRLTLGPNSNTCN